MTLPIQASNGFPTGPKLITILFFLCVASIWLLNRKFKLRRLRHQRQREEGFTREKFIDSFRPLGVPDTIAAAVFDHYTSQGWWKDFPLSPDDTYSQILFEDRDDIEEDAHALVERLGMVVPRDFIRREYGDKPLVTARDMVLWLDWMRQHQPAMPIQDERSSPGCPNSFPSGTPCKFGFQGKNWEQIPHKYPGVWAEEKTSGPNRLVIAPASRHVELLLSLSKPMSEPLSLLYILVSPRGAASEGRYESSHFLSREDLVRFLRRFGPFLESDGRHHFWIRSIAESDLLVYDNHNLIFGYGCLDRFKEVLSVEGLVAVPEVTIPYPHSHFFHEEFDREQNELLSVCDWQYSPLQDEDE